MSMSLYIGAAQTRHLVVAVKDEDSIFSAVSKELDRSWGRYLPAEVPELKPGRWRLTIELTADSYKQTYYSIGKLDRTGNGEWSHPSTERPDGWA
jgi:hypothetical protein